MSWAWDRPVQRSARLFTGLVMFGLSLALLVNADLGLDPWNVFHQGVSGRTGLTLGTVTVLSSFLCLLAFIPLRQRVGLGTVANALVVGPVVDLGVWLLPEPTLIGWRVGFLFVAVLGTAVATGLYVGAGWGPGPRDGLMTGLAGLGIPLFVARAGIEVSVLSVGWALGGTVGVATVVFAVAIGPLVHRALPWLIIGR